MSQIPNIINSYGILYSPFCSKPWNLGETIVGDDINYVNLLRFQTLSVEPSYPGVQIENKADGQNVLADSGQITENILLGGCLMSVNEYNRLRWNLTNLKLQKYPSYSGDPEDPNYTIPSNGSARLVIVLNQNHAAGTYPYIGDGYHKHYSIDDVLGIGHVGSAGLNVGFVKPQQPKFSVISANMVNYISMDLSCAVVSPPSLLIDKDQWVAGTPP